MFTIRCTAKLFKRTGLKRGADCPPPTTALGDWYANLIYLGKTQRLLFVSEASLLAVITPARDSRDLSERLTERLPEVLNHLQIPPTWIDVEIAQMDEAHFSRTASRQILGTMIDFLIMIKSAFEKLEKYSAFDVEHLIIDCPCKALEFQTPIEMAQSLFKKRHGGSIGVYP